MGYLEKNNVPWNLEGGFSVIIVLLNILILKYYFVIFDYLKCLKFKK